VTVNQKSVYFDPLLQLIDSQIPADLINSERSSSETATPKPGEEAGGQTNLAAITRPLNSDINGETNEISEESTTKKDNRTDKHNDSTKIVGSQQPINFKNINHQ